MNLIKEKKINKWICCAALYLAFCFSEFMSARGNITLFFINYGLPRFLCNDVVAFFVGGLVPFAVYELLTNFVAKMSAAKFGAVAGDLKYALRFFYIGAGILSGLIKLLYFIFPLMFTYGNIFISTGCALLFFIFFMIYALKANVKKELYSAYIYHFGGSFLVIYGFLTLMQLLMGLM